MKMSEVDTEMPIVMMSSPAPRKRSRAISKTAKKELVRECEKEAIDIFERKRHDGREGDSVLEAEFIKAIKKCPSIRTLDLGIMLAIEAEWLKALEAFIVVDPSSLEPPKIEASFEHPIIRYALSFLDVPPASDSKGRGGYANAALFYAIVTGRVESVEIMARHMELNIGDVLGQDLLHYVYLVNRS